MLDLSSPALVALAPSPSDLDAALAAMPSALALVAEAARVERPQGSAARLEGLCRSLSDSQVEPVALALLVLCANPGLAPDARPLDLFLASRTMTETHFVD